MGLKTRKQRSGLKLDPELTVWFYVTSVHGLKLEEHMDQTLRSKLAYLLLP